MAICRVCLVLTVCAARGFAEPADQVNQQKGSKEEKIQQKAREEYAELWRIEKIVSKKDLIKSVYIVH